MDEIHIVGPIGPDNFERGDRALIALAAYNSKGESVDVSEPERILELGEHNGLKMLVEGLSKELGEGEVEDINPGHGEAHPVAYLVADLCHLLRRYGFEVEPMLEYGIAHFASDVIEQAWTSDDEWDNLLQTEDNIGRARRVMAAAGVPDRFQNRALKLCGLLPYEEGES